MLQHKQVFSFCCIFFFNDTATTEIYTLSLHDALPISGRRDAEVLVRERRRSRRIGEEPLALAEDDRRGDEPELVDQASREDRKSTRLNSSHANISYAVFCLKKKKHTRRPHIYSLDRTS